MVVAEAFYNGLTTAIVIDSGVSFGVESVTSLVPGESDPYV